VTRGTAFIESYVVDSEPAPERCWLEFYETDELGGQIDNWCGPTTQCLLALTRSAGFPRAELKYAESGRGGLVAWRHWEPVAPQPGSKPPFLCSAVNNRHNDILFQPRKDEYLVLAFLHDGELTKDQVRIELDQFGVPALVLVRHAAGYWQVNAKLPPGVGPGAHEVRIGIVDVGFSDPVEIRMLPPGVERHDAQTPFVPQAIEVAPPVIIRAENTMNRTCIFHGFRNETLACRFTHADGVLDLARVELTVDGNPWPLLSVGRPEPGLWQINARLKGLPAGEHLLRVRTARSPYSEPFPIESDPV
jgi:hypothetical protein